MIRYQLTFLDCRVSLPSDRRDNPAAVQIEGDEAAIAAVFNYLRYEASGAYGHTIDPQAVTPIDLDAALQSRATLWGVERIEGGSIVEVYESGIPDDAVS